MDDLVNNLIYLFPVALFIAARIISIKQSGEKKRRQKESTGKLVEKIQEVKKNPAYAKSLTEDTEVYIPPSRNLVQNSPRAKKKAAGGGAKTAPPQGGYTSPFFKEEEAAGPDRPAGPAQGEKNSPAGAALPPETSGGILPEGLTTLQQALMWSEILAAPRGEQDAF
ncbi:MAG: hypothetical protein LBO65_05510 [Spirochaetaceae bacterium]|nr:hypothetical protein [Spirochaetaceae bacterium]